MANQTVYPYGTGGELPSSIGIINDLTTGGVNKALSAEMGKTLNTNLTQLGRKVTEGLWSTNAVINRIIKELYITGLGNTQGDLLISFDGGSDTSAHGVTIYSVDAGVETIICSCYFAAGDNGFKNPVLTLGEYRLTGISGYIIVDWNYAYGHTSTERTKKQLNKEQPQDIKFSPNIKATQLEIPFTTTMFGVPFNVTDLGIFGRVHPNGTFYASKVYRSLWVKCVQGDVIYVTAFGYSDNIQIGFSTTKDFASLTTLNVTGGSSVQRKNLTAPSDGYFLIGGRTRDNDQIIVECPAYKSVEQTELEADIMGLYIGSFNKAGNDGFSLKGYILPANGTVYDPANVDYYHTDYIKINTKNPIRVVGLSNSQYVALVYFYDSQKNAISGLSNVTTNPNLEYIVTPENIPANAVYVRASVDSAHRSSAYIKQLGITPEDEIAELREELKSTLDIVIPDIVYAIVGTELNIYNDAVSLSIDKGLQSPLNYQIQWSCNKGTITDRCFRFTPVSGDVGNTSCTCKLYDAIGSLIASKTFTIKVIAKNAISSAKNIVYFGDSLGPSVATDLYDNFHDENRFSGTIPNMLGTKGTTKHYEAVGGYGWVNYATAGSAGFRISVNGVTSMQVGAVYSDGSHNFEVYEVNITEGVGNCLLGKHYSNQGTLIMPSGTLTKVSGGGDTSVPYTDAFQESVNPLWNDTTQKLDINQYKQMLVSLGQLSSASDKIDAVSFQFGINDRDLANDLETLRGYISDLYELFVGDNADCKFIVGLTTSSGNDVNGSGANYGATFPWKTYLENTYKIRKFYLSLLTDFPNMRIATPNLSLDRYYGYAFGTRQISNRYTETEQYHTNFVHPGTSGYWQMADAYLACYVGVLTE